jgi:hypothetical protein
MAPPPEQEQRTFGSYQMGCFTSSSIFHPTTVALSIPNNPTVKLLLVLTVLCLIVLQRIVAWFKDWGASNVSFGLIDWLILTP